MHTCPVTSTVRAHPSSAAHDKAYFHAPNSVNPSRRHEMSDNQSNVQGGGDQTHCRGVALHCNCLMRAGGSHTCRHSSKPGLSFYTGLKNRDVWYLGILIRCEIPLSPRPSWTFHDESESPGRIDVPTVSHWC